MGKVDKNTERAIESAAEEIDSSDDSQPTAEEKKPTDKAGAKLTTKRAVRSSGGRRKKAIGLLVGLAIVVAAVAMVPFLRYGLTGLFVHKSVALKVVDDASGKPVSGALVTLGRADMTTDKDGIAKFSGVAVGDYYAKVEKKYYGSWSGSVLVPIFSGVKNSTVQLKATGRTVTLKVRQSITDKPVGDVTVSIGDASAVTDDKGEASVVVAVGSIVGEGKVSADRFVSATFRINPKASEDQVVEVKIAPAGKVYYLSKATGVISVMSANVDGSDVKTVVAGTGKEYDHDTAIMATKDWKYLALNANREGKTRLYSINTTDGSMIKIDNEEASYQMIGWLGNSLVYTVSRERPVWQGGQSAIKAYNVESRRISIIDELQASGTSYYDYQGQYMSAVALTTDRVIYGKSWMSSNPASLGDKKTQIISATIDGSKLSLKDKSAAEGGVGTVRVHAPNAVYVLVYNNATNTSVVYDIINGKLSQSQLDDSAMNSVVLPTYLVSPAGTKTAWSDVRDGKSLVFLGDANGSAAKQLSPVGYTVYGWMTDAYLLLTKDRSELYIYPTDGSIQAPVKITDYHRPTNNWMGIGYGGGA